ncbi:tetratricopeptide repeat protein [Thalassotalea sp. Y01]|uniref:tetratricopeptide repeat protein n=1 Tax=Thalassotalea sp. Y01 TaxID=2729613 RepID=UPI00145D8C3C|nr:tetratricopeptide repeat protein [Thalassotalea sp. Y01]NMP16535.1 tetratricopeptide repeat protein [Thalassotalea sp. Y01]
MHKTLIALSVSSILLSGCTLFESQPEQTSKRQRSATLAQLDLQPSPAVKAELPRLTLEELSETYKDTLAYVEDEEAKAQIQQRIAVLEMMQAEEAQMRGDRVADGRYYQTAITSLEGFIKDNPDSPNNDKLLYQLAKAYDLQGEQDKSLQTLNRLISEYPENDHMLEAEFRKAEILFSSKDYIGALSSYDYVVNKSPESVQNNPYFSISLYMMGWSFFKLEQNQQALTSFSRLLDEVMPYKFMSQVNNEEEFLELIDKRNRQLTEETFTVMTLIFSDQGSESIAAHYARIGERPYEYLHYDLLSEYYLSKQRYSDAANVYDFFIERSPYHHVSVLYSIKKMEIFRVGQFPAELTAERAGFVDSYQFTGPYWQEVDPDAKDQVQEQVAPVLLDILQEFSQNTHANAQEQKRLLAENNTEEQRQIVKDAYLDTAKWYQIFLDNFPEINGASTVKFYMAESYTEVEDHQRAAKLYEDVAYSGQAIEEAAARLELAESQQTAQDADDETPDVNEQVLEGDSEAALAGQEAEVTELFAEDFSNEAGYALILTYDELIALAKTDEEKQQLTLEQREFKAKFIDTYSDDERVSEVQRDLFQEYFKEGDSINAIAFAQQALDSNPDLTTEQRLSALLVIGHSQFAEEQYEQAESTYATVLDTMPAEDERRADMIDRLAASIYRQGEVAAKGSETEDADLQEATRHFARVLRRTPNSKVRLNAQYDMSTYLLELERYPEAIDLMVDFRERYPNNALTKTLPPKLAYAYQETEQWQESAAYLKMSWAEKPTSEDTRQMLWLAGETYMKADNKPEAMLAYRTYAHTYKAPFNTYMESLHIMSEFYRGDSDYALSSGGDLSKRNFWLDKIIKADENAGTNRTTRSKYLAASASMHFADELMGKYKRAKLTLPLKKSLTRKRQLLEQTLTAYNKTANYQVKDFTTVANYRIAEVYSQLAADLMDSERPKDLDELALEQYDILLEEQAFPFEDKAIEVHETNAKRTIDGIYDEWVKKSFADLSRLLPGRYNKQEQVVEVINEVY